MKVSGRLVSQQQQQQNDDHTREDMVEKKSDNWKVHLNVSKKSRQAEGTDTHTHTCSHTKTTMLFVRALGQNIQTIWVPLHLLIIKANARDISLRFARSLVYTASN